MNMKSRMSSRINGRKMLRKASRVSASRRRKAEPTNNIMSYVFGLIIYVPILMWCFSILTESGSNIIFGTFEYAEERIEKNRIEKIREENKKDSDTRKWHEKELDNQNKPKKSYQPKQESTNLPF